LKQSNKGEESGMPQDDEKKFLVQYRIEDYERPSVTVDVALFAICTTNSGDYRKLPRKNLSILLIRRDGHPFKDSWALPGGFVHQDETVEQAAYRELSEESGIGNVSLSQLEVFSEPGRDPSGWIISCAFMALASAELFTLQPSTDASDSKWFDVNLREISKDTEDADGYKRTTSLYELSLTCDEVHISALLEKRANFSNNRRQIEYKIIKSEGLAFDHAKIIAVALTILRDNLDISLLAYNLLPDTFTLTELQTIYEIILDKKLTTANFRRKTSEYVIMTDEYTTAAGHRPAKLFKRNLAAFEKNE
jgi:8-oxo-dGTP diphosphatase